MKAERLVVLVLMACACSMAWADFPTIGQGNVQPNDERLGKPIDKSKAGELTLASVNIRNLGGKRRCIRDFEAIVDLIDEADVVLIQEAGLGVYDNKAALSVREKAHLQAIVVLLQTFLGDEWIVLCPTIPSGTGRGAETSILAHRKVGSGYQMMADWIGYEDLGDRRDMAVWKLIVNRPSQHITYWLGSVHLKYDEPYRGQEMKRVVDWLLSKHGERTIVAGDFNWGYKKKAGVENYLGEKYVRKQHEEKKLFQLFRDLSYLGHAKDNELRTNLGYRSSGYFYDQFLTTPMLADELADGGQLLKDCGMVAFGVHNKYMRKALEDWRKWRSDGLDKYLKHLSQGLQAGSPEGKAMKKARRQIEIASNDDASYVLSDHRVIWMQLKIP